MRTPSLKHFIFLSKFTYLTIGRAEPNWGDSILSIKTHVFTKLWRENIGNKKTIGERVFGSYSWLQFRGKNIL